MSTLMLATIIQLAQPAGIDYPESRRVDQVDVIHDTSVSDPYRWLENDVRDDQEVSDWVDAQNAVTHGYLDSIQQRPAIHARLQQLWDYPKVRTPFRVADRYYFSANDGLQNQDVLYTRKTLGGGEVEVLIDPNTWSEDGTVALGGTSFSPDGRYLAYAVADAGSDWKTWRIRDLSTGLDLPDRIKWSKFADPAWVPDGSAFYYGRYEAHDGDGAYVGKNEFMKLYRHVPGTPQSRDTLVLEDTEHPRWSWGPSVTEDGRWLVINVWRGSGPPNLIRAMNLETGSSTFIDVVPEWKHEYEFIGSNGDVLYFMTDEDAPRKRVVSADLSDPANPSWSEVIPEQESTLKSVQHVGGELIANTMQDATTRLVRWDERGVRKGEIELPGLGTASASGGERDHGETFYSFSSFTTPPTIYHFDLATGASRKIDGSHLDFDFSKYVVRQVFYSSKDGTRVPMFLVHHVDMKQDGSNPTLLYGYGGFDISLTPYFSPARLAWVEMGGMLAIPNLRGGGEYGREWHEAGTRTRKQNVFDDFIAAAEWLINEQWTQPSCLAIQGGSNGGLLVGACMTQRPDLFGACLPAVGVMDMLRFHRFTIGAAWQGDFGDIENEEEFNALYAYSPYHNLKAGTSYPATMVTTGDTDDRVVPGHSFKYAAALQHAHAGDNPVLIRINRRAGHGAGKPTTMRIAETADVMAFLFNELECTPRLPATSP
ncbi:MAG: prolyl oligopeptidase family serine peptidase [Phycisphaerales bacterium]|nr:prolyl oligopeptidase family serine peptidase [Phycisphaerales bacterium]